MPITAADLEEEYQEEQSKKAKAKASSDHVLREGSSITRTCRFVLIGGVTCAALMLLLPRPAFLVYSSDNIQETARPNKPGTKVSNHNKPVSVDFSSGASRNDGTHRQTSHMEAETPAATASTFDNIVPTAEEPVADIVPPAVEPVADIVPPVVEPVADIVAPQNPPTEEDEGSIEVEEKSNVIKKSYTSPLEEIPKITHWAGVAKYCPPPVAGDWVSETQFLEKVLRSFGKQRRDYKGFQKMQGFQDGKIFDEQGMFAFTPEVKSVAIDVGAANNPLSFDLDIDSSQVAFFVEPLQWLTLQTSIEGDAVALKKRGGCTVRWDGFCTMHRFYVFPAAVSNELGQAQFHATASPYCGSLESFTAETNKSAIDPTLRYSKDKDIAGVFAACYQNAPGKPGYVPTISLKALIERIPKRIVIKYVKIDAQGHDWNVLLSAGDQITRIEYARFEMQVDPLPGRRLVKNIPSYAEVESHMASLGFKHKKGHACYFEHGTSSFSKAVNEMECVFCRRLPCIENARPPLGENPREVAERNHRLWLKAGKPSRWSPAREGASKDDTSDSSAA